MSTPAIHVEGVSVNFADGSRLFDSLSLTAKAGQCTCILGPSGCGKSTLLRLISGARGFEVEGRISFVPENDSDTRCAWMGQNDLLLPWLNLLDNVVLGAKLRRNLTESHKEEAAALIREAGLGGYENALPAALSGGMRQRGALLRTLMEHRQILLMDEPFSALDALTRMKLQNLSSSLTRGSTVLLVTHDPLEALRIADRIIVLGGSPVRVKSEIELSGATPRQPGDSEINRHHGPLLEELMGDLQ